MSILDQTYQPWSGDFLPRWRRVAAMVTVGLRQAFTGTVMRVLLFMVYAVMCAVMGLVFVLSTSRRPVADVQGNLIFKVFLGTIFPTGLLVMVLAALVGARLISRDLRHNAVAMYFSKAITPFDYLAGKFATLAAYLLGATLVPAVLLWIGQWSVARETVTTAQRFADLAAILGHSAAIVIPCAMYVLALSAFSRTVYVPAALWIATYLGSLAISDVLHSAVKSEWCRLLAWPRLVGCVGAACYPERRGKPGLLDMELFPPMLSIDMPVWGPLSILAAVTILSAVAVLWRLRKFEEQE